MGKAQPNTSLKEWFGFNREKYDIDPEEASFVAFNKVFADEVLRRSERYLITGVGPKYVILHKRGDGKTHLINFVANSLEKGGLIEKIYFVCPALVRGSRYPDLHRVIILKMHESGLLTRVLDRSWKQVSNVAGKDSAEPAELLSDLFGFADLANAYTAYKMDKVTENDFIRYLGASKITARQQEELNVKAPLDTIEAVRVVRILAELFWKYEGRILMLIIDEVDNLKEAKLGARDFKEAFRLLAEATKVGLIFICNVAEEQLSLDVLPSPLKDVGVVTRIGSKNYMVKPEPMRIIDLHNFVVEVNHRLKGPGSALALARARKRYADEIEEELYPLTLEGFKEFQSKVQHFLDEGGRETLLLPRSVLAYVNECCGEAILQRKEAVDAEVVNAVGAFDQ